MGGEGRDEGAGKIGGTESGMNSIYDYRKFAILYVDDEEMSLKYFTRAFGERFRIFTATSAQEGAELLERHRDEIGLLMTDQRMPGQTGVWLLEKARQLRPAVIRILVTAYSDIDAAIEAVNSGAIYKFITKPWDVPELETTLRRGLEFFLVERERDRLLKEKMSVLHEILTDDRIMSLGLMTAGLSHHIRNALVSVKTFLDLIPLKLPEAPASGGGESQQDFWGGYYQKVQQQVDRINNLLSDLWGASEKQTFRFADEIQLGEILGEVVERMRERLAAKRLEVHLKIPDSLPALTVDRPKFTRLFELLLQDELVSLPAGSRVEVEARAIPGDSADDTEVQIEVSDNGPGLPQEHLRYIFDPFVTRSNSPMECGINLMACYFIVYNHGGRIGAINRQGNGTTFTLRFRTRPHNDVLEASGGEALQKQQLNFTLWENTLATG